MKCFTFCKQLLEAIATLTLETDQGYFSKKLIVYKN